MENMKKMFILLILISMSHGSMAQSRNAYRNFWMPKYNGERLSYCSVDGKSCGRAIANQYCELMGFSRARKQLAAYNIGFTNYLGSRAHCRGWNCKSFMTIECVENLSHKPPASYYYRMKKYVYPRYAGYRVDWCYKKGNQCGRRPAYSFCRRIGYMNVRDFEKQKNTVATKTIGTQELCFGKDCSGFSSITCYR